MSKVLINIFITALLLCALPFNAAAQDYEQFLDKVERQAFDYFLNETNKDTGMTLNTTEECAPATNAATGFMLSSLVIGVERGWITEDKAYTTALKALKTFKNMESFEGFTYHYFNVDNCGRMWASEVSCIDTGIFLAGAITIGEYFKGTEVSALADELYRKTNWQWFLNGDNVLQMSWTPEKGFSGRIDSFSEGILCYILAMGSLTHPIPKESWDSFVRPVSRYNGYKMIYVSDGSLFQYLFPLAWLDLRDKHDKYADYWQNAIKAIRANKKYCLDYGDVFITYREGFWGISASLSPIGYKNFGAKPGKNRDNGTVAPYAVAGSIPLVPEFAIPDYYSMYERVSSAIGKYGLTDAFNVDRRWAASHYISIDQGLTLLMIENYRSGLIWKYFMQNIYVKKGLEAAGFVPGRQDEPSEIAMSIGNPNDKVIIKKIDKNKIPQIILTGKNNKNVEMTIGRVRDDSDCSGFFYIGYDNKNLYITGRVRDDSIVTNEIGNNIYKNDCVEIFFDTNKDGFYFDRNKYDYQLGIAPSGPSKQPQAWAWGYVQKAPDNIKYDVKIVKDGYVLEVIIPFDAINGFGPGKNKSTRFSVSIHDIDADGKSKKLTWSIDPFSQPGKILFGTLELG